MSDSIREIRIPTEESGRVANGMDFESIPLVDFSGMIDGTAESKRRVAAAIRDACTNVGFFYLSNHGVPQEQISSVFAQCPRFFDLPLDRKMQWHVKRSSHLVGYVAMRDENANPLMSTGDFHEAFDFIAEDVQRGSDFLEGDFRKIGNQWPQGLPGFREAMTEYSVAMRRLSRLLFAAFALALDLPEDYFSPMSSRPMMLIRILSYPSQPGPFDEARMGTGAHTDHECFTILSQDEVAALQVRNRRGEWVNAAPVPNTFVINIGDLMARWTNGLFASTPHRVANLSGKARYSIPCFVGANSDAVIEALPSWVGPQNPAKFPPVVAGEYVSTLIYHQFNDNRAPHPLKQGGV